MHLEQFYILPQNITGKTGYFLKEESHHIQHVLRKNTGDIITACDGEGSTYQFEITHFINGHIHGKIRSSRRLLGEPVHDITLAPAIIKPDRFDWLVEKSVEIGVKEIIPVITELSVQTIPDSKQLRWNRIAISALKQCGRSYLPKINTPTTFQQVLNLFSQYTARYILYSESEQSLHIEKDKETNPVKSKVLVLVGPESGFSENEINEALELGFKTISLGSRRLRSETAGIVALSLLLSHYGELD